MRKRLTHLPAQLLAMAIVLVVTVPVALWRDGGTGAAGVVAAVGLVTLSYVISSLVIAWIDLKARHMLVPVAMATYIIKFTVIGFAMWAALTTEWGGLTWMGVGVIVAVIAWMTAHAVWVWRAKIPYVEIQ
ncbi:hypothetical protein [Dactylosporangium matsuzakiense]|uniref:ATP synthase protein I n=1 Tax=Dactylosporangium matsuzakiense TaxID=53360 RepID=A0A9W6KX57_9ACTN|nr:hypothetical protein [Dactylosporangium matsuzakiense]UWZ46160.1 hypothetical protein Dmats_06850 [Dactylosporangium matsuzakiense]GLL07074.1 hypothetical protein GCM10017581_088250 [Dactylosporangium matsuzakiense]